MSAFEEWSKSAKFLAIILQSNWTANNQSNYLWNGKYVPYNKRSMCVYAQIRFRFHFGIYAAAATASTLVHRSCCWYFIISSFFFLFSLFLIRFPWILHWPSLHDNVWQSEESMYKHIHTHTHIIQATNSTSDVAKCALLRNVYTCFDMLWNKYDMGKKWKSFILFVVEYMCVCMHIPLYVFSFCFMLFYVLHLFCVNLHNAVKPTQCYDL